MPTASAMHVIPSGAPLGAEIVGVDLSEVIDDQSFQTIDAAYHERTAIVFRDQTLIPAQHLRFARRFGELEVSPCTQFALPGCPEVLLLSNILDANGRPIGNADAGRTWHTDLSYTATPPWGSLLYAVEVSYNERGEVLGDTLSVSTAAAYEG
jgi:taurine dioxygenase